MQQYSRRRPFEVDSSVAAAWCPACTTCGESSRRPPPGPDEGDPRQELLQDHKINSWLPCSADDKYERHKREICFLIKYLDQRANNMIMALLNPFLENTASTTEFQRMSFAPVKETHDQFPIIVTEFITQSWSAVWDLSYLVSPIGVPVTGSCWYLRQKSLIQSRDYA